MELNLIWLTMIVAAVASTQVSAPDKPDFSGSWTLQSAVVSPDTPKTLSVEQTVSQINVRGERIPPFFREIKITRTSENGTRSETFQIGISGGTVVGQPIPPMHWSTHQQVGWEGGSLVIETGTYDGPKPESGTWSERREVWSLDPAGLLNVSITTRSSREAAVTVTLIYQRMNP